MALVAMLTLAGCATRERRRPGPPRPPGELLGRRGRAGSPSLWDDFTGWLGFGTQTKSNPTLPQERGFGIDPNGLVSEPANPGPLANGAN